jgi:hypothetical protein
MVVPEAEETPETSDKRLLMNGIKVDDRRFSGGNEKPERVDILYTFRRLSGTH